MLIYKPSYSFLSFIKEKNIHDFEKGRTYKYAVKETLFDNRFRYGESFKPFYNKKKKLNLFLEDNDFKQKLLSKINRFLKIKRNFNFNIHNLGNIKIKVQNFKDNKNFDLVVYELEPK